MRRCLALAQNARGNTYPNPMVGAVFVRNGSIIGEGWHHKAGEPHAEVHALKNVKPADLAQGTLYVNLEPCAHTGKTPPCCNLIISKGVKRVVVGAIDPNPKTAGKGIKAMEDAGIEVIRGVLEDDCKELNKRFYCYHTNKRPYIILKWAQSADGFMAPKDDVEGSVFWISDTHSQQLVHRWRSEEHAILVGRNTVELDNPQLTTRKWEGKNPIRLIIDPNNAISKDAAVLNSESKTVLFNYSKRIKEKNLVWEVVDEKEPLQSILEKCHGMKIQSILVEGGQRTLSTFLDENIWDECRIITATKTLVKGLEAPKKPRGISVEKKIVGDSLQIIYPER